MAGQAARPKAACPSLGNLGPALAAPGMDLATISNLHIANLCLRIGHNIRAALYGYEFSATNKRQCMYRDLLGPYGFVVVLGTARPWVFF